MAVYTIVGETVLNQAKASEAEGSADTIETLVAQHAGMVFRIAYSILRNHHDAEDAAQECFLRVLKARKRLAQVRNSKTWLARIAWTAALDRRRRTPRFDNGAEQLEDLPAPGISIDHRLEAKELQGLLQRLIASLPAELRVVVELSTVQELNSVEIAEIVGAPESSIRTRLFRARKILKEKLAAREITSHECY